MHAAKISDCSEAQFDQVKQLIQAYELDDRVLKREEFVVVNGSKGLLGFGRVREFSGFSEMCSLGILPELRHKGLGKMVTEAMIQKAKQKIYLVCIIPEYFENFGFKICSSYPPQIQEKLDYCTESLVVPEKYVVMLRQF